MLKSSKHKILPKSKDGNYGSIEETEIPSVDYSEDLDEDLDKGEDIALSRIPNLWIIEATLFSNVFLSGFDGTVTASTYQTIGNEFNQMSISNWITTAYLITSTSFQPLYGSFSDALGRRNCLFFANGAFTIGCLACGFSKNIYMLSFMRALTGIGGGGLITLSTIVNSDVIPSSKRGIFQAFQNLLLGFGAICGASFGGTIASSIGWRWCFLIQVPISVISSILMNYYVPNQKEYNRQNSSIFQNPGKILRDIDVMGSILIITGLTLQLLYLSLGCSTSKLSWTSPSVLLLLVGSVIILLLFILHERKTSARAIIPMELVNSSYSVVVLSISILVGFASYAYLFTLPLFFQIVLGDSTAKAGLRLTIPSLFTPVGSLITGFSMSKYNSLRLLLYIGISLMFLGNFLFLFIEKTSPNWLIGLFFDTCKSRDKSDQATATSTLYLFRSIGSVWGVAISAGVIQLSFAGLLRSNLKGLLDENKIKKLIVQLSANSSYIGSLHGEVKNTVIKSFDEATKRAHLMSTLLSLLALILCILKDNLAKPKTRR
ncbi:ANL_collapsed_G0004750.mRNA.1.CDS.1 [Saccharomyces cerevisiae]|nr:ANL_collapsed_G0004750.mRNA.1.CDS.1 [Saccharomyces cerevisiae]